MSEILLAPTLDRASWPVQNTSTPNLVLLQFSLAWSSQRTEMNILILILVLLILVLLIYHNYYLSPPLVLKLCKLKILHLRLLFLTIYRLASYDNNGMSGTVVLNCNSKNTMLVDFSSSCSVGGTTWVLVGETAARVLGEVRYVHAYLFFVKRKREKTIF